jgi:3-phosphoshikimate 1-carboxyvinyltransferase
MTSRDYSPNGENWSAPVATKRLSALVRVPGSKSLTNRELVLSALASGKSKIVEPLRSRDTELMIDALRSLGVGFVVEKEGEIETLIVTPSVLKGDVSIDCGLAGTVMRFLPPLSTLADGPITFDGDAGARQRPMTTTIESIRSLGVEVEDGGRGSLPFTVAANGAVAGGIVQIDASKSSQFVSGLLLSAARFENGLTVKHVGDSVPSLPHIEMTIECLRGRGVRVTQSAANSWRVEPGSISGIDVAIEPDLSNAAPFLVAALIAGGTVTIPSWPTQTTQVGDDLREYLEAFGAKVTLEHRGLTVDGGEGLLGGKKIPAVALDLSTGGELAPSLVSLAVFAEGTSEFTGIAHLRGHETDRLAALVSEINTLGGNATELDDGIRIEPAKLHGGTWHTYHDHRMATAGAIIGLAVKGVEVENVGTTSKTLPGFTGMWEAMLG